MIKRFIILLLVVIPFVGLSQTKIKVDNVSVRYIKAKKVSNKFNMVSSSRIKTKGLQKVLVKCKIKRLDKNAIDLNKFSLVDHKNKLRYRPTDISTQAVGQVNITKLLKNDIKGREMYKMQAGMLYEPEIVDTFTDYDIEGYTNIEVPYTFGNKKKNIKSVVYFHPVKYSLKGKLFFAIYTKHTDSKYELYYGNEKITAIEFE